MWRPREPRHAAVVLELYGELGRPRPHDLSLGSRDTDRRPFQVPLSRSIEEPHLEVLDARKKLRPQGRRRERAIRHGPTEAHELVVLPGIGDTEHGAARKTGGGRPAAADRRARG